MTENQIAALARLASTFRRTTDTELRQRAVELAIESGATFGDVIDRVGDASFRVHLLALRELGRVAKVRGGSDVR